MEHAMKRKSTRPVRAPHIRNIAFTPAIDFCMQAITADAASAISPWVREAVLQRIYREYSGLYQRISAEIQKAGSNNGVKG
jgi:hypothetical protein